MHTLKIYTFIIFYLFLNGISTAQDMRVSLKNMISEGYESDVFKGYLSPLAKALGTNMSAGLSFSAQAKQFPHMGVSVQMASTQIPSGEKSFTDRNGSIYPTLFGQPAEPGNTVSGIDENNLSFPILQLNLGFFSYLEFIFRYTNWEIDKIGKSELRAFAIKYELIEIPFRNGTPFYVSLMAHYQNLQLDNYIESAAFGMTFNLSKQLSALPLTFLGGVQYTNNILTFESDKLNAVPAYGTINIDGLKGLLYQLSVRYGVGVLGFQVEYDIGMYNSLALGIRVDI